MSSPVHGVRGRAFILRPRLAEEVSDDPATAGVAVRAVGSYEEALDDADVVCAATYAQVPVVRREWIKPGTHITSVGYNPQGREIDDHTVVDALLFVESRSVLAAAPERGMGQEVSV
ncbi:hypothetical protein ACFYXH_21300 [Streptomyces sp. NPDC002730]|uniref:hypothetical protein n=1 Tax=Streptomyces sp. NPDC002730 TaxID=3364662 RepID=UPI0036ADBFDA